MAIDFPDNPNNGDIYLSAGILYKYESATNRWITSNYADAPVGYTGSQGVEGPEGPRGRLNSVTVLNADIPDGIAPDPAFYQANVDEYDQFNIEGLGKDLFIDNPTGTPVDGFRLIYRITSASSFTQDLTWGSNFREFSVLLPEGTVSTKTMYIGALYNLIDDKWDVIMSTVEN